MKVIPRCHSTHSVSIYRLIHCTVVLSHKSYVSATRRAHYLKTNFRRIKFLSTTCKTVFFNVLPEVCRLEASQLIPIYTCIFISCTKPLSCFFKSLCTFIYITITVLVYNYDISIFTSMQVVLCPPKLISQTRYAFRITPLKTIFKTPSP